MKHCIGLITNSIFIVTKQSYSFFKKNIKEEGAGDTDGEAEPDKAIASEESKKPMDSASSENKDRAVNG